MVSAKKLLRTSDLAAICQVDPKTIHNWIDKKKGPPYVKTPGEHLRFRVADVVAWLVSIGFDVPEEYAHLKPKETT